MFRKSDSNYNENNKKNAPLSLVVKVVIFLIPILFLILFLYFTIYSYIYEAKNQIEYDKKKSAGNCRILNTALAYDNNYKFEMHSFTIKDTPTKENGFKEFKKLIHVYAVDENNRIYDVSNGVNIQNMSYDDFFKMNNYVFDELLLSGEINKNHFQINYESENLTKIELYGALIGLYTYYLTYKIYR